MQDAESRSGAANCAESVVEMFARLQDLPAERREAALQEECAERPELLIELRQLLAAGEAEQAETARAERRFRRSLIGERLGAYRITGLIGQGGMGAVYLGEREDGEFDQRVAIKLVAPHFVNFWAAERFRQERQILAGLNHPAITRLLDGGATEDGQPYLVMEFIEGENILNYARRHKLTFDQRLRVFFKIAEALDYLHRNLIVHLDLKPSNILITADGQPKVLDFGTAKLLSETSADVMRAPALSIRYAAPEQLRGEPGTPACDQYSLALVFFELLSGNAASTEDTLPASLGVASQLAPFVYPSQAATEQAAASQRSTLGKLRSRLRGDLDAILRKALAAAPSFRYRSVAEFAADVERSTRHEAVLARRGKGFYPTWCFLRRNWPPVLALIFVLTSFASAAIYTRKQQVLARDAFWRAQSRMKILEQRGSGDEERTRLRRFLATYPVKSPLVKGDLYAMLAAVPKFGDREALNNKQRSAQLYEAGHDVDQMVTSVAVMALWERWIYGDMEAGLRHWHIADDLLRQGALKNDPLSRMDALRPLVIAGWATRIEPERTRAIAREAVRLGQEYPDLISPASLANMLAFCGMVDRDYGDLASAQADLEESLAIFRRSADPAPSIALYGLTFVYSDLGRYREAEEMAREGVALAPALQDGDPGATANALSAWGFTLYNAGNHAKGIEQALKGWELSRDTDPKSLIEGWMSGFAAAYVLNESGHAAEAEQAALEAQRRVNLDGDASDPRLIPIAAELGIAALRQNHIAEARSELQRSMQLASLLGHAHWPSMRRVQRYLQAALNTDEVAKKTS